jgi:hypothetical protein
MMHSNPLIQKWEEIHGKKENPKVIKADEFEGEVTLAQVENAFKKWSSNTSVASNLTTPSVATSNTGITKASNTYTSHDIHDTEKSFLQVADKIKQGKANVGSMTMEHSSIFGSRIIFEVYDYEEP